MPSQEFDSLLPCAGDALLLVDLQNDFLPGGSLAVPAGDAVIPVLNRWIARFRAAELPIFATRDWHPADHCSFRDRGGPWPPHCVAASWGADLSSALDLSADIAVLSKGTRSDKDAYSAFDDTDLARRLRGLGVMRVIVGGLATDYCVRATVLDALQEGFAVLLLAQGARPVDVKAGDGERAIAEMVAAGACCLPNRE